MTGYLKPQSLFSGGGGLVSTAEDYMRFCKMLLQGGQLGKTRLLETQDSRVNDHESRAGRAWPMCRFWFGIFCSFGCGKD